MLGVKGHPARFPAKLPEFFIKYLTEPGDLVVDIFGGSNTTGYVAESLDRNWMSFELEVEYIAASVLRFLDAPSDDEVRRVYADVLAKTSVNLEVLSYAKFSQQLVFV